MTVEMYHGQFCRNPLHPGPCKGWKNRIRSTTTGRTPAQQREADRQMLTPPDSTPAQRVKPAREIGTPSRRGKADFAISPDVMERDWAAHNATLNAQQRADVRTYSGGGYTPINRYMRTPPGSSPMDSNRPDLQGRLQDAVNNIQNSMAPAPRGTKAFRGLGADGLGLGPNPTLAEIQSLVGQVLVNDAFTSTSVSRTQAFEGFNHGVEMEIEVPKGTPALWMNGNSGLPWEQELLLASGAKMEILGVEERPNSLGETIYRMKARVVP